MTLDQGRRLPRLWLDFRKVVREWKPDIIHHTNFHHVFLLACGPTYFGVPSIYHVHNAFMPSKARRLVFKVIDRSVNRYIAVSNFVKQNLLGVGLREDKIAVVRNGVPGRKLNTGKEKLLRQRYGWTEHDVIVGIAGQVAPWKGHEDFIQAIALAQRQDSRVKGMVIGGGSEEYVKYLESLAHKSIPNSVVFTGYFGDMGHVYRELDVLVVASRYEEPFSLSAAEAMSYGLPVVGTLRGGVPEVLGHELREWLVPSENPAALAEKIALLAKDAPLREQVGRKAHSQASRNLTLERCSRQMIEEYNSLVFRGRGAGLES